MVNATIVIYNLPSDGRSGFVPASNIRGTFDILWSCFSALFICLWSMLHLNVPAATDTLTTRFWRRTRWLLLGINQPEFTTMLACGQWASARRSVRDMRELGYEDWTMVHGFYADMGGFVLVALGYEPFPISAKQVVYLVRAGYMPLPAITKDEILDKGNADVVGKSLAYIQTGWLALQIIARGYYHLPITPLELVSLSLSLCSLTTLFFWLKKPLDIQTPTRITINLPLSKVRELAGVDQPANKETGEEEIPATDPEQQQEEETPLSFIEPNVYISRKCGGPIYRAVLGLGLQRRQLDRLPNDRDPLLDTVAQHVAIGIACTLFASIHLACWNFPFASRAQELAYRICCWGFWAALATYGFMEVGFGLREGFSKMWVDKMGGFKLRWPVCLLFHVPVGLGSLMRTGVLVVALWSMFDLPDGAFVTVNWTSALPHI